MLAQTWNQRQLVCPYAFSHQIGGLELQNLALRMCPVRTINEWRPGRDSNKLIIYIINKGLLLVFIFVT